MTPSRADLTQLAAQTRLTGELLDAHGRTAWDTTSSWQQGPKATNTDPTGANHWWTNPDTGETWQVPNDPTGDQATHPTPPDPHHRYLHLLDHLEQTTTQLINLLRQATPTIPQPPKQTVIDASLTADGWCTSCYRDNQHLNPTDLRTDGTPYYTGLCRWCGEFRTSFRRLPPIELLRARHEGRRITQPLVTQALRRKKKRRKTA